VGTRKGTFQPRARAIGEAGLACQWGRWQSRDNQQEKTGIEYGQAR